MSLETFLLPVIALIIWSLVMWALMYATRLPAMRKAKIDPQEATNTKGAWRDRMPEQVNWVADNYNHLHEQPTAFYALMFALALMEKTSTFALNVAWLYVVLRVLHSLSQIIGNLVVLRFALFVLSSLALIVLAYCAIS